MNPFFLERSEAVLVVVDVQERLLPAMEPAAAGRGVRNLCILVEGFQLLGRPVLHTEQYPRGLGPTVAPLAGLLGGRAPLAKETFSCWRDEGFRLALRETAGRMIVVAGIEAHVCVLQTALDLLDRGFGVHIPADAVFSRAEGNRLDALALARQAGAVVSSTETILFQLLERSGTEEFRRVSRLVK